EFADRALRSGGSAILLAKQQHLSAITPRLRGFGTTREEGPWFPGELVALDAELTLARFMVDGWPDDKRFFATIGELIATAAAKPGPVHVFGEMVGVLYEAGHHDAALQLEALWIALTKRHPFKLICAYPHTLFSNAEHTQAFEDVCGLHDCVLPREG